MNDNIDRMMSELVHETIKGIDEARTLIRNEPREAAMKIEELKVYSSLLKGLASDKK